MYLRGEEGKGKREGRKGVGKEKGGKRREECREGEGPAPTEIFCPRPPVVRAGACCKIQVTSASPSPFPLSPYSSSPGRRPRGTRATAAETAETPGRPHVNPLNRTDRCSSTVTLYSQIYIAPKISRTNLKRILVLLGLFTYLLT